MISWWDWRIGAAQRYAEIKAELDALESAFPGLAGRGVSRRPIDKRRVRVFTDAQRRQVSERMTRYWATQRAQKANGAVESPVAEPEPVSVVS